MLDTDETVVRPDGSIISIYSISVSCITLLCDGICSDGFQKDDIPKRMQASAISARRQSLEGLLAMFVMGGGLWGIGMAGAILMYGKHFSVQKISDTMY